MQRIFTQIDKAIAGETEIATTGGTVTLDDTEYVDNDSRQAILRVTGTLESNVTIVVPARSKKYNLINATTGDFTVSLKAVDGSAMAGPAQGSVGQLRVASDKSIIRIGPYVDVTSGAITSTSYALQSSLTTEVDRATEEEETLAKLDGSRAFTGKVSGVSPTADAHFATKRYVDNLSGAQDDAHVTTGTSTAYVVTTGRDLELFDGLALTIRPHATNGQSPTLNVDGTGAKPVRGFTGKSLPSGVGIAGTPYRVIYVEATDEWLLSGFFNNPYQIPIGGFLPFCSTNVPNSNFILPFGQALSRTTYATFYNLVGTAFGEGNGTTTFNAPDLRGRAIFGLDNMGGASANRITAAASGIAGTTVGASGGDQTIALALSDLPDHQPTFSGNQVADHSHYLATTSNSSLTLTDSNSVSGANGAAGDSNYTLRGSAATPTLGRTNAAGAHTPSGSVSSINGGVTQTPVAVMPPALMLPMLLRVI